MKPNIDMLFGNIFDDKNIINTRLLNFARNAKANLVKQNTATEYDAQITLLTNTIEALEDDLGGIDTGLTVQKGKTRTNNQVLAAFKKTMSDEEPFIARALGGSGTAAYLEFYPNGITEYGNATKTNMPTLTSRINKAATKYTTQLGALLSATLQGYAALWEASREDQELQKGGVKDGRAERSTTRYDLEIALVKTIHHIAERFAGDVDKCKSFFSFHLLFPNKRSNVSSFEGSLAIGTTKELLNKTLAEDTEITVTNTGTNAPLVIWLAATNTEAPSTQAKTIQPGETLTFTPTQLGSLAHTFLLVKNTSEVNEAKYAVEVAA
jgi:hypothetical protein